MGHEVDARMAARLLGPSCAFAPRSRFEDVERQRVSALNGVLVVQSATIDDVPRAALECHNGRTTSTPIMVCQYGDLSTSSASVDGDAMMSSTPLSRSRFHGLEGRSGRRTSPPSRRAERRNMLSRSILDDSGGCAPSAHLANRRTGGAACPHEYACGRAVFASVMALNI